MWRVFVRVDVVTGYHLRVLYAMEVYVASLRYSGVSGIGIVVANCYNPLKRG